MQNENVNNDINNDVYNSNFINYKTIVISLITMLI